MPLRARSIRAHVPKCLLCSALTSCYTHSRYVATCHTIGLLELSEMWCDVVCDDALQSTGAASHEFDLQYAKKHDPSKQNFIVFYVADLIRVRKALIDHPSTFLPRSAAADHHPLCAVLCCAVGCVSGVLRRV